MDEAVDEVFDLMLGLDIASLILHWLFTEMTIKIGDGKMIQITSFSAENRPYSNSPPSFRPVLPLRKDSLGFSKTCMVYL